MAIMEREVEANLFRAYQGFLYQEYESFLYAEYLKAMAPIWLKDAEEAKQDYIDFGQDSDPFYEPDPYRDVEPRCGGWDNCTSEYYDGEPFGWDAE